MSKDAICPHCKGSIAIRNPKGFCDHLQYPENCKVCQKMREPHFVVVGPRDKKGAYKGFKVINTTSKAKGNLWTQLSPFHLGPVKLWGGNVSRTMENAWQYSKVYEDYANVRDREIPTKIWKDWAESGWRNPKAIRYPMGRDEKPLYSFWDGKTYGYVEARAKIYVPLYARLIRKTEAFKRLKGLYRSGEKVALWDFDGYLHEELGMTLLDVLTCPTRKMGHAFVLLMMLKWGEKFYTK